MLLLYAVAIFAAWRALRRCWQAELGWVLSIILLGLLAVDQHFDLADHFANLIRSEALAGDWYGARQPVQRELVGAIMLGGIAVGAALMIWLRGSLWQVRVTALATVGLLALALVKGVSLHGLDAMLARPLWLGLPLTIGNVLELGGIALAASASFAVRRRAAPEALGRR